MKKKTPLICYKISFFCRQISPSTTASCACSYYCGERRHCSAPNSDRHQSDACIEVPLGCASSSHLPRLVETGIGAHLIPAPGQLCVIDAFVAVLLRKLSYRCSACTSATKRVLLCRCVLGCQSRSLNRRCFRSGLYCILYTRLFSVLTHQSGKGKRNVFLIFWAYESES